MPPKHHGLRVYLSGLSVLRYGSTAVRPILRAYQQHSTPKHNIYDIKYLANDIGKVTSTARIPCGMGHYSLAYLLLEDQGIR